MAPNESPKSFYIFGQGIAFSMSPTIHNAGFKHNNLPYNYQIKESPCDDTFAPLIQDPGFGGASVTMPHKITIGKYCQETTEHAKRIGAINTLVVKQGEQGRSVLGDNTDWTGLAAIIRRRPASQSSRRGLVIGAGGASRAALYALHQSGVQEIYLVNRTRSKAERIAADVEGMFHVEVADSVQSLIEAGTVPDIIIGTIPADKTGADTFPRGLFAREGGLCIDMSYKPRMTPLLQAALEADGWGTVAGVEVLLEQAFGQFEMWTGVPAPQQVMRDALAEHDARTAET